MHHYQHDCAGAQGPAAPAAAELNPTKDKADGGVGQVGDHENKHGDSAEATAASVEPDTVPSVGKRVAGLRARLALAHGHVLHELADGTFLVTWRGLSRTLKDLDAVDAFAVSVGAHS
ncbi:hypothetical protein IP87_15665 [beta proteobacterium AAP121]|nr:hypothetical protein IP80_14985 [beta proteobacterium AAP65]KPF95814.1 hypothetical protein IP87_15665 [beta proteobacterium AAP121]